MDTEITDNPYKGEPQQEQTVEEILEPFVKISTTSFGKFPIVDKDKALKAMEAYATQKLEAYKQQQETLSFQERVKPWLLECFGQDVADNKVERNFRFIEESLELVQSLDIEKDHVLKMVDYVFSRSKGEPFQEVGGVMITLAALCLANNLDMHQNGETELARIWTKVDKIRSKQVTKEVIGVAVSDLKNSKS